MTCNRVWREVAGLNIAGEREKQEDHHGTYNILVLTNGDIPWVLSDD